jgi:kinesin family protein 6/9
MKTLTLSINSTKQEMDTVQQRLFHKQDEKKAAHQRGGDFDDENEMFGTGGGDQGMVIDEEELMLLREMKDLKRSYRDQYEKLRQVKLSINDAQNSVDSMKQQIVIDFERWYSEEFESSIPGDNGIQQTYMGTTNAT